MLLGPPSAQGARVGAIGSGFAAFPAAWLGAAAPLACMLGLLPSAHGAFSGGSPDVPAVLPGTADAVSEAEAEAAHVAAVMLMLFPAPEVWRPAAPGGMGGSCADLAEALLLGVSEGDSTAPLSCSVSEMAGMTPAASDIAARASSTAAMSQAVCKK